MPSIGNDIFDSLRDHAAWLKNKRFGKRADFTNIDLSGVNLAGLNLAKIDMSNANLSEAFIVGTNLFGANLSYANLSYANLSYAKLTRANLNSANLTGAFLAGAKLTMTNLSNVKGIMSPIDWMNKFERDDLGWIVYKAIDNTSFSPPDYWDISPGKFLIETPNTNRADECGCGISFATLGWCSAAYPNSVIWRCRIRYQDGPGIVVPYNTNGKARCERLELLEPVL